MCVCVCVCVWTLPSIYMSKMNGRDHKNLTTNFDCIYCQNFSMKIKLILVLFFIFIIIILITLVSLHNTHVLNCTRNIKNKNKNLHTKYQKTFSSSFLRSLPNNRKWYNFLENAFLKMNHFLKNVYAKTNKV